MTERERSEVAAANEAGSQPIVFVHGLWLLAGSWDNWRELFGAKGYATVAPGWPDDPETVAEAKAKPELVAGKSIGQILDHLTEVIGGITRKPVIMGHSFGGMFTQILAGRGLAVASVAIDPAPFRGVLPLPLATLKSSFPVLRNPTNRKKAVLLTFEQFRYSFANLLPEEEARSLYETYSVPGAGKPLFQAAMSNLNPKTEARVDTKNPNRGPLLITSGDHDHTVAPAIAKAAYKRYKDPTAVTEFRTIEGRGHSLTIDHGWAEVAQIALDFLERQGITP